MLEYEKKAKAAAAQAASEKRQAKAAASQVRAEARSEAFKALPTSTKISQTLGGLIALGFLLGLPLFGLYSCVHKTPEEQARVYQQEENKRAADQEQALIDAHAEAARKLKTKMMESLKDPESAKFPWMSMLLDGTLLCGYVNSKNSFGAYTGKEFFSYDETNGLLMRQRGINHCDRYKNDLHRAPWLETK